jgi:endogenous inhibitor of DNA gyrase (YacG/DUF329 family)
MKVTQVKCPQCSQPIYMKQKDEMFYCQNCGAIHYRDVHGVHRVPYEIADIRADLKSSPSARPLYMPFWRLYCNFNIRSREVQGGTLHKLAALFKGTSNGGMLYIYVPAADLDTVTFRRWAVALTTGAPSFVARADFANIERLPTSVNQEEAIELADFVAVTLEAEQPGTLQYLDYDLKVQEAKMVYLPFVQNGAGLTLAL